MGTVKENKKTRKLRRSTKEQEKKSARKFKPDRSGSSRGGSRGEIQPVMHEMGLSTPPGRRREGGKNFAGCPNRLKKHAFGMDRILGNLSQRPTRKKVARRDRKSFHTKSKFSSNLCIKSSVEVPSKGTIRGVEAAIAILPQIPRNQQKLSDNSSSPAQRSTPAPLRSKVPLLVIPPSRAPSTKDKVIPANCGLLI